MNEKEMRELLEDEEKRLFKELETLKPESDEYKKVLNSIETLHKLGCDSEKLGIENNKIAVDNDIRKRELENEKRKLDIEDRRIDIDDKTKSSESKLKFVSEQIGTFANLAFLAIWLGRSFRFEETGYLSSTTGKFVMNMLGKLKIHK